MHDALFQIDLHMAGQFQLLGHPAGEQVIAPIGGHELLWIFTLMPLTSR